MMLTYLPNSFNDELLRSYGIDFKYDERTYHVVDSLLTLKTLGMRCPKLSFLYDVTGVARDNVLVRLRIINTKDGKPKIESEISNPMSLVYDSMLCFNDSICLLKQKVIRKDVDGLNEELNILEENARRVLKEMIIKANF